MKDLNFAIFSHLPACVPPGMLSSLGSPYPILINANIINRHPKHYDSCFSCSHSFTYQAPVDFTVEISQILHPLLTPKLMYTSLSLSWIKKNVEV